ncbi:MFS transporter [Mesorhizobium sp.]|uniref:MFS transporter n=1 Tax=Mesorhizobium sp. TaxID=1871066 RepID=UPI000FD40FEA|nr:MFS transporter [Mesorhizobium sp.]RUV95473.1 MFS transporter [Mesorhizobium sp. M5C.F.Ca.IN.020.14.1.1]RWE89209.1 MAG: MFS transporter [Mesorhizobium sp.]RWG51430.1 MAG: MFS transporter [Mesorhizobium sp.]RWH48448.1 MAG: MFS transporter [Mesorhizobium sp.]RWH60128.1 MAG: MFS transporter [Mesorhizobium sp.]
MASEKLLMIRFPMPARLACSLFFLSGGVGIGAWAASLPVLAAKNNLDKGLLGLVLLCFALGAILLMVNVGHLTRRFECSTISICGALVFAVALVVVPHVASVPLLAAAVFVAGAGFGTLDVSMNTDASVLENRVNRHIMSSLHGAFSLGNLTGAFLVGQILANGGALTVCMSAAGLSVACLAAVALSGSRSGVSADQRVKSVGARRGSLDPALRPHLFLLGVIAFLALLAEGGMMDWSAVYIVTIFGAAESTGAYGFAIFATTMAIGRLTGDWMTSKTGPTTLLLVSTMVCAVSVLVFIVASNLVIVFCALAASGFGVANIVPAVFAAAGRAGGAAAGQAMSIVTTMGYAGLLLGPALLGFIAQASSLAASFGLVCVAFLLIAVATRILRRTTPVAANSGCGRAATGAAFKRR